MKENKLMDYYELTMAYSDFKNNRGNDIVYFDVYFRKNIDNSGYSIFGGLAEIVDYLNNVKFNKEDRSHLKKLITIYYPKKSSLKDMNEVGSKRTNFSVTDLTKKKKKGMM